MYLLLLGIVWAADAVHKIAEAGIVSALVNLVTMSNSLAIQELALSLLAQIVKVSPWYHPSVNFPSAESTNYNIWIMFFVFNALHRKAFR